MKIDTHGHYHPMAYVEALAEFNPMLAGLLKMVGGALPAADPEKLIDSTGEAGVDHTVLGVGFCQPWVEARDDAVRLAMLANDLFAEAAALHPKHLSAIGCVPLPHVDDALNEASRCLDELGFRGLSFGVMVGIVPLDSPEFNPLWQELNRREAIVQIHASAPVSMDNFGIGAALDAPGHVCTACARLALSGVTTRYPKIRFIATCLGGGLPYHIDRLKLEYDKFRQSLAHRSPEQAEALPVVDVEVALRSFYYDTEYGSPRAIRCTCEAVGADRVVFGTNWPFGDVAASLHDVENSGLPTESVAAIVTENPRTLFGFA